jgi:hypothetical protein
MKATDIWLVNSWTWLRGSPDELPEERPDRRDMGVCVVREVDAEIARPTRSAQRVQRLLVDLDRGEVLEQRAVAPAVSRCVDASGRQALGSGLHVG